MNQITIHETDSALVERITQLAEKKGVPPEEGGAPTLALGGGAGRRE